MRGRRWSARLRERELSGALVFGLGLLVAAGLNFAFASAMGRMLAPKMFATLGVLVAALLAVTAPVNSLQGGTEMFAALHDRFPRGRRRLIPPLAGLVVWGATMAVPSATVRAAGWFTLGSSALLLLSWNRGALAGLGRFTFVGASFAVDGAARLALAVGLVGLGFGLDGASAGYALGIVLALLVTELAVPRLAETTGQPLGREVWPALIGLFALGVTQIIDVFAIRLANPGAAASYVGAASLARLALFAQMPAAAYGLRRAAVEGPRRALPRTLLLALGPGLLALALVELAPHELLRLAYGGRYLSGATTIRVLGCAMFFGGLATVGAQVLMGARSTAWAWTVAPVAILGTPAVIALAHAPVSVAAFSLLIQGSALLAVALPTIALVRVPEGSVRRALILNWRDTGHPQGGGSEVFVEQVARRLASDGWGVTVFCSAYPGAASDEIRDGVRFLRRGGWRTVYLWAFVYHAAGRFGRHDVVIDVKNGVPFFAATYCRRPVVCLVHHIHREQWPMNFRAGWARLGWWIESRLSIRAYGRSRHVAVSQATGRELAGLGISPNVIDLVHNGCDRVELSDARRAGRPTIVTLGRLVPHKRVELVLEAAAKLRVEMPDLRVVVIGQGQWLARLQASAERLGIDDDVTFTGWVDQATKERLLSEAWVLGMPSVKEGWGLAVMEAAVRGTPTVAFRTGGLEESVLDGETGLLADDTEGFTEALRTILLDATLRERLGSAAAAVAGTYSWERTAARLETVLTSVIAEQAHRRVPARVPVPLQPEAAEVVGVGESAVGRS
jgi:glycosyltransferase involved in cell wall biosynthesis